MPLVEGGFAMKYLDALKDSGWRRVASGVFYSHRDIVEL